MTNKITIELTDEQFKEIKEAITSKVKANNYVFINSPTKLARILTINIAHKETNQVAYVRLIQNIINDVFRTEIYSQNLFKIL